MMWSVVLAVTLSVVLMEVMPSSQQPVSDDDDTAVRLLGGEVYIPPRPKPPHQRDVSDEMEGIAAKISQRSIPQRPCEGGPWCPRT
ncbi:hypothetical protein J6590_093311 [Homalodisca vitripennis]|nr:hypothetical protein J6590_093311 [Homalodisca vitripennis]